MLSLSARVGFSMIAIGSAAFGLSGSALKKAAYSRVTVLPLLLMVSMKLTNGSRMVAVLVTRMTYPLPDGTRLKRSFLWMGNSSTPWAR